MSSRAIGSRSISEANAWRTADGVGFAQAVADAVEVRRLDFDRRLELYGQAQQLLIDEVGVMPLSYPLRGALVKPWVQGFVPSPREGTVPGDLYFDQISISGRP